MTLDFDVPARGNAGAVARRRLDSIADQIDHPTMAKVRLLVSELVNRAAVERGRDSIHVSVSASPAGVRADVSDDPDADQPVRPRHGLDWALFLVRRMADRWGTGAGVWFEIDCDPYRRRR